MQMRSAANHITGFPTFDSLLAAEGSYEITAIMMTAQEEVEVMVHGPGIEPQGRCYLFAWPAEAEALERLLNLSCA